MILPFIGRRPQRSLRRNSVVAELMAYEAELDRRSRRLTRGEELLRRCLRDLSNVTKPTGPSLPVSTEIRPATPPVTNGQTYVIGSWFLADCHRFLTRQEPEWMHYVTGLAIQGVRTLDRRVTFRLTEQSTGYVKGDETATRDALCDIETYGHALHGVFHSHRLRGPAAVRPSEIDRNHQERLQRGRYPAISAIFSDDGYIGFFTVGLPFVVQVYGKGVDQLEAQLFRLSAVT